MSQVFGVDSVEKPTFRLSNGMKFGDYVME